MPRKAIPAQLQVINGNPNRLTKKELESRMEAEKALQMKADDIKPPSWLSKVAKKEFKRLASLLQDVKLITEADIGMLATYCDAYARYIEYSKIIDEEGIMVEYTNKAAETNKVPHPLLTKQKAAFDQMKTVASEFGLSPSSRSKIAIPKKEEKEPNELDRLFGEL